MLWWKTQQDSTYKVGQLSCFLSGTLSFMQVKLFYREIVRLFSQAACIYGVTEASVLQQEIFGQLHDL